MNRLEPGWYLDVTGNPIKVWSDGATDCYANEGDKAIDLPPSITRLLPLTMSDWDLLHIALEEVCYTPWGDADDRWKRLRAIADRMTDRRER